MQVDLDKTDLQILLNLLNQGRFTLVETQRIMPLANKLAVALQSFKEEEE